MQRIILAIAAFFLLAGPAGAQEVPADEPLQVGVIARPPFAISTADGAWLGLAIDLWRLAAEDLGLAYEYREITPEAARAALAEGEVDVVLPVDATPVLEATADATHPIYTATLGVASNRSARLLSIAEGFLSWQFLNVVLGLSATLLVVGALVWGIERKRNKDQFHPSPIRGLGDGFWWAGVTLTTIGYGDKAPVTLLGRSVAMMWMLVGLAISASLTAAVVTLADANQAVNVPEAFTERAMGTVKATTAAAFLSREGVEAQEFGSISEALRALEAGEVEAVAAAAPALAHAIADSGTLDFTVRTTRFDPHYISFALPETSALREPLNVALLERLVSESGLNLIERYLPNSERK